MHLVRFADDTGTVRTGVADASGTVRPFEGSPRIADLLQLPAADLRALVEATAAAPGSGPGLPADAVLLLPPLDGLMELWAAGVTYERSRDARIAESTEQSVYERIYDAERPELFFKSQPWRVVTDDEPIAVREDSELNVPEPELGLVLNRQGETVGYVIVDDVSSRSIEGSNPLYLPQAKVYAGSAAVSSGIVPFWEVEDATALKIGLVVRRSGAVAYEATTTTASFHRPPRDLVDHLWRSQPFPDGAVLSTGTGIVPGLDFTLRSGDVVEITVEGVGTLSNPVRDQRAELDWLVEAIDRPLARRAHRVRPQEDT
ncbi:fumarylacetoacetate hydrolase family protein [Streptomyces sp. V3I7]|uniref:fumarylacetoacetate hydrolase family protein n=1 Tax=Streptomyces sp. V3I7 TaxID=3042278 RepID=UPI002782B48D|nr:fumarylacetoacetate hydrolase family protein [Streptomyces sp. V3I7]MDQ0994189.1 2-dehydro-3-deoxy-D-arabinonate dehydratase [Streptomyces sp. V3I7]